MLRHSENLKNKIHNKMAFKAVEYNYINRHMNILIIRTHSSINPSHQCHVTVTRVAWNIADVLSCTVQKVQENPGEKLLSL